MKRLSWAALGAAMLLTACPGTQVMQVQSDPRILRGVWEGEALENCGPGQDDPTWSSDGNRMSTHQFNTAQFNIWDGVTGQRVRTLAFGDLALLGGRVFGDRATVLTRSALETYRVSDGTKLTSTPLEPYNTHFSPQFSDDLERVLVSQRPDKAVVLEVSSGKRLLELSKLAGNPEYKALSPDGTRVAVLLNNRLEVWQVGEVKLLYSLEVRQPWQVGFTGGGQYVVLELEDAVRVYRLSDQKQVLEVRKAQYQAVQVLPSSQAQVGLIRSSTLTGAAYPPDRDGFPLELYSLETGQKVRTLEHKGFNPVALHPSGLRVLGYHRSSCELEVLDLNGVRQARLDLPALDAQPLRLEATATLEDEKHYRIGGSALLEGVRYTLEGEAQANCDTVFRQREASDDPCKNRFLSSAQPMTAQLRLIGTGKTLELSLYKQRGISFYEGSSTLGTDREYSVRMRRP